MTTLVPTLSETLGLERRKLQERQLSPEWFKHGWEDQTEGPFKWSENGGSNHAIIADPTGRTDYVLELTSDTTIIPGRTGTRTKLDVSDLYKPDPNNLPFRAEFSAWFYLVDNQSFCNLMQFKTRWRACISPGFGTNCGNQTAHHMHDVSIQHAGGGDHWLDFSYRLRPTGDSWDVAGNKLSVQRVFRSATPIVQVAKWHKLSMVMVLDDFAGGNGYAGIYLDDEFLYEAYRPTLLQFVQEGPEPVGVTWDTIGATTYVEGPVQWTYNNYMTGNGPWNPTSTTIYFDDARIRLTA